ncbi:MAG: ATP synthase F1 subunit delta [Planctomycetia bacterium]|nr:ATP synthase F1 subunit delta [Planctomycetia bacterium]
MEQKESQYMAVGRVYATALYDSAQRTGQTADVLADIESIGALLAAVPRLEVFLKAATINTAEKLKVLESAVTGSVNALTLAVLQAMARRDRLDILREFTMAFGSVRRDRTNRLNIDIISAHPLPADEQQRIAEEAGRSLGRQIDLTASVDASLLGGVQLKIGDMFIDGSVKRRLQAMKSQLHRGLITGLRQGGTLQT